MQIKQGVSLKGLQPQMLVALAVVEDAYRDNGGYEVTITAGCDGHHLPDSLHYKGFALDFRTRNVPEDKLAVLFQQIKDHLGAEYDCVKEIDHIHIEYQPKS